MPIKLALVIRHYARFTSAGPAAAADDDATAVAAAAVVVGAASETGDGANEDDADGADMDYATPPPAAPTAHPATPPAVDDADEDEGADVSNCTGDADYADATERVGQREPPSLLFKPGRSDLHQQLLTRTQPEATEAGDVQHGDVPASGDDSTLSALTVDIRTFRQKWHGNFDMGVGPFSLAIASSLPSPRVSYDMRYLVLMLVGCWLVLANPVVPN